MPRRDWSGAPPEPRPGELAFHPPASQRRRKEARMVTLFVVAGLPVAAVVWLVIGPVVTVLPVGPDRLSHLRPAPAPGGHPPVEPP